MFLKYIIIYIIINCYFILVRSDDCLNVINFYKNNNLSIGNDNCCLWPNVQCVNNRVTSFQFADDTNIKIDFNMFPILEELSVLSFKGKYALGGTIPYTFFCQPKLVKLFVENSNIWEIPNFSNSVSYNTLEIISFKDNLLTSFPYDLVKMPKLKELNLSNNKMSDSLTQEIKNFPSLEILDISSNFLTGELLDVPSNIKELNINGNQFTTLLLSSLQSPHLEIFLGNDNKFDDKSFEQLMEFKSLKKISLDNTGLTEIPKSIGNLNDLKVLSLKNNDIITLPEELDKNHNLEEINLVDNPKLEGVIRSKSSIKNAI